MKNHKLAITLLLVCYGLGLSGSLQAKTNRHTSTGLVDPSMQKPAPGSFEFNSGQYPDSVKFIARAASNRFFIGTDHILFAYPFAFAGSDMSTPSRHDIRALGLQFIGSKKNARVRGLELQPGKTNYFLGKDSASWQRSIPTYGRIQVEQMYSGIDAVYYLNPQGLLEFDLILSPRADPGKIVFEINGADGVEIDAAGDLVVRAGPHRLVQKRPLIYQDKNSERNLIDGRYVILPNNRIGLALNEYDRDSHLYIDPVLSFSSYQGGSGMDSGSDIAVDKDGNIYVAGITYSPDFPAKNPIQGTLSGFASTYVSKFRLTATGPELVYSTYVGGDVAETASLTLDTNGNVYVTGSTSSPQWPVVNAFQPALNGVIDGFVFKLNSAGNALVYSSYFGGSCVDRGRGIAVDSSQRAYITGVTCSRDYPTVNPFQSASTSTVTGIVMKIAPSGNPVEYATYLGGNIASDWNYGAGIAVDSLGNAYVTGRTNSVEFPVRSPLQATFGGGYQDAFVSKFNSAGMLTYSTYLGGAGDDFGMSIDVDSTGNIYITGRTTSLNFPVANSQTSKLGGTLDAFLTKLNSTGNTLLYSRYLGGNNIDLATGLALGPANTVFVVGTTESADFPTVNAIQPNYRGATDSFVTQLLPEFDTILFSTYFGGSGTDTITAIAVDKFGNAYLTGATSSTDLPLVDANQSALNGSLDGFVAKISAQAMPVVTGFWPGNAATGNTIFVFGGHFVPNQTQVAVNSVVTNAVQVLSDSLLIFLLPPGVTSGPIAVTTPFGSATSTAIFGLPLSGLQITGCWPGAGSTNTVVFVFGSGFVVNQTQVTLNGASALVQVLDPGLLLFLVPASATTGPITVTTPVANASCGTPFVVK